MLRFGLEFKESCVREEELEAFPEEGRQRFWSAEQRDIEDEYEAECDRSLHEWMDEGRVGKPRSVRRR